MLKEFTDENKISEYKQGVEERFAHIIRSIGTETNDLISKEAEISKVVTDINNDFIAKNFAGINNYQNEFKKHLSDKAGFFVPEFIQKFGNRQRYDEQKISFALDLIKEEKLLKLIASLHKFRKGLDQEILIDTSFNGDLPG